MILDGGLKYFNEPKILKQDLDKLQISNLIKETKITVSKHLIITFNDITGQELFLAGKHKVFQNDLKIIDLNRKKKKFEIVIKGLSYKTYDNYSFNLSQMGITKIEQMNKSNENFRLVKAECVDEGTMKKLINEGLKLDYFNLKVEEFIRPIRPLQCFNCQQFNHVASNCPTKENPVCLKCGGQHSVQMCLSDEVKCANCEEQHTSSYKLCPVFQSKLDEKLKKMNTKSTIQSSRLTSVRTYSQVINNNKQELQELKSSIIDSVNSSIENNRQIILEQISKFQSKIDKVQLDLDLYKAKQIFHNLDVLKIVNIKINDEQVKKIVESAKQHGVGYINGSSLSDYNKINLSLNKDYSKIKYLNDNYHA